MRQCVDGLAAKGAVVIVVSFDPVRRVRGYCRRFAQPFTCVSDETRAAYGAFGLGRASWLRTLTPRALAPYVRLYLSTRRASFGRVTGPAPGLGADIDSVLSEVLGMSTDDIGKLRAAGAFG